MLLSIRSLIKQLLLFSFVLKAHAQSTPSSTSQRRSDIVELHQRHRNHRHHYDQSLTNHQRDNYLTDANAQRLQKGKVKGKHGPETLSLPTVITFERGENRKHAGNAKTTFSDVDGFASLDVSGANKQLKNSNQHKREVILTDIPLWSLQYTEPDNNTSSASKTEQILKNQIGEVATHSKPTPSLDYIYYKQAVPNFDSNPSIDAEHREGDSTEQHLTANQLSFLNHFLLPSKNGADGMPFSSSPNDDDVYENNKYTFNSNPLSDYSSNFKDTETFRSKFFRNNVDDDIDNGNIFAVKNVNQNFGNTDSYGDGMRQLRLILKTKRLVLQQQQPKVPLIWKMFRAQKDAKEKERKMNKAKQEEDEMAAFQRQKYKTHQTQFVPLLSISALTDMGDFFKRLQHNVRHLETAKQLDPDKVDLLTGNHLPKMAEHLTAEAIAAQPSKASAFLHAVRTYRPTQHMRALAAMTPEGYHGNGKYFTDPNFMWMGLG